MKKLLVLLLLVPFFSKAQFTIVNNSTTNLVEVRTGTWPLNLQRIIKESDTAYALQFRDQGYTNDIITSVLRFQGMEQLKYFEKALSALKSGGNGDIAKFKDYTIKRMDVKKEGVYYVINCNAAGETTNFQQSEADKMITAIKQL